MKHFVALIIHGLILMALFSGIKLGIVHIPDDGISGDIKKFFLNA